jgi:pyruvate formate lyase activating enzyme
MVTPARQVLEPGVVPGEWWHRLEDGRVQCDLCPRACRLRDGQRGFCFVRRARAGGIALTGYGRASGFCIDPIEKKPLNHFHPGTSVLSFGTAGCNLGCRFCQNWDLSRVREEDLLNEWASPEAVAEVAAGTGCRSVAFTYNEPVIFAEYAIDCARAARARGVETVAVSAGYITAAARPAFFSHMDAANIDLKSIRGEFYRRLCAADLAPVLDTLRWLKRETGVWLEVTNLVIPGHNDGEEDIARLCDWFVGHLGPDTPLHFTAFHPDFRMTGVAPTPAGTLARARRQAIAAGIRHVYTGNVTDPEGQSTFCASCGRKVIERDGYRLGAWNLDASGRCRFCRATLAGRFDAEPGRGGPARARVTFPG